MSNFLVGWKVGRHILYYLVDRVIVMNVVSSLFPLARRSSDKPALIDGDSLLSYRELWSRIGQAAGFLSHVGGTGKKVLLLLPNGNEFIIWLLAVLRQNMVIVPLRYDGNIYEINAVISDAQPDIIVTSTEKASLLPEPILKTTYVLTEKDRETSLDSNQNRENSSPTKSSELAGIHYTYGGDGRVRGACLSHANYIYAASGYAKHMGITAQDRFLVVLPMPGIFILAGCILAPLIRGATVVVGNTLRPRKILNLVEEHQITAITGIPVLYHLLAEACRMRGCHLKSVRWGVVGGAQISAKEETDLAKDLGFQLVQGYGLTECFPISCNPPGGVVKAGSLGVPGRKDIFTKIVDLAGKDCSSGCVGEIWVKSPTVMSGYYRRSKLNAEILRPGGWVRTGDLGWMDDDGYLWFSGMQKKLYNLFGNKVDPLEVANVLSSHPAVNRAEILVEGEPATREAPKLVAYIWLHRGMDSTEKELRDYLRQQLAAYKVPNDVFLLSET